MEYGVLHSLSSQYLLHRAFFIHLLILSPPSIYISAAIHYFVQTIPKLSMCYAYFFFHIYVVHRITAFNLITTEYSYMLGVCTRTEMM